MAVIVGMSVGMSMGMGNALIRNVRIDDRMARLDGPLHLVFDPGHDRVQADGIAQIREHKGQIASHFSRVTVHDFERGTHVRSKINFVYYKQVRASDPRTALARHLIATGDVDDVDPDVDELGAERGCKIIASTLDEDQLEARKRALEIGNRLQVHRGIFANRRVGACTGLNSAYAIGGKRSLPQQGIGILFGVNVIRYDREVIFRPQSLAETIDESRLA